MMSNGAPDDVPLQQLCVFWLIRESCEVHTLIEQHTALYATVYTEKEHLLLNGHSRSHTHTHKHKHSELKVKVCVCACVHVLRV